MKNYIKHSENKDWYYVEFYDSATSKLLRREGSSKRKDIVAFIKAYPEFIYVSNEKEI